MISGLARAGKVDEAMTLLDEGTARKLKWNDRTFCALLVACGEAERWTRASACIRSRWSTRSAQGVEFCTRCWTCRFVGGRQCSQTEIR